MVNCYQGPINSTHSIASLVTAIKLLTGKDTLPAPLPLQNTGLPFEAAFISAVSQFSYGDKEQITVYSAK